MQFVVLAPNDWNGQWMNRQQLFSRIGRRHAVVYSTGALSNWDLRSSRFKSAPLWPTRVVRDSVTLYSSGKAVLRIPRLRQLDKTALRYFGHAITAALDRTAPICLYVFHPMFADYLEHIPHDALVYHAYDDFSKSGSYSGALGTNERNLATRADYVFASSRKMRDRLATLSGRSDVRVVPNGVDYDHFSRPRSEPADLVQIPHPRVGYSGSLNQKVDFDLLDTLAAETPNVHFVLIGGVGILGSQQTSFERAMSRSNVHHLGARTVDELPAYAQHCDVNVMIYRTDNGTWAVNGYPLKLHEYLAVGKPIISSAIDAVLEFGDSVTIARTVAEWRAAIRHALEEPPSSAAVQRRRAVASQNTWDERVARTLSTLNGSLDVGLSAS